YRGNTLRNITELVDHGGDAARRNSAEDARRKVFEQAANLVRSTGHSVVDAVGEGLGAVLYVAIIVIGRALRFAHGLFKLVHPCDDVDRKLLPFWIGHAAS